MLAYRGSDVHFSWDHEENKPAQRKPCAYIKEGKGGFEIRGSWLTDIKKFSAFCVWLSKEQILFYSFSFVFSVELELYLNETDDTLVRRKRQLDSYEPYETKPNKTRCPLLLVADYRFFQEMGGSDTKTTINYLVKFALFQAHRVSSNEI